MSSKLLVIALCACFFIAIEAALSLSTFSDSTCTIRTGMYQSTNECALAKRSGGRGIPIQGFECMGVAPGPYYSYDECTQATSPTTVVPEGWQSVKYASNANCDFTTFEILATSVVGTEVNQVIVSVNGYGFLPFNVTANCNNDGLLSLSSCASVLGCTSFDLMPNNTCHNMTIAELQEVAGLYSGVQTSCSTSSAAPTAGTPSVASPTTAGTPSSGSPVASNTPSNSNTPTKTSAGSVVFVGSAVALVALTSILF